MNFYFIFSRAWELLVGSIIAFYGNRLKFTNPSINNALAIFGLMIILSTIYFFDKDTIFPGWNTLFPVLGTAFIIVYSNQDNLVGRILSNKYMVSIGLISYSLYLWHQPIFAFLNLKSISHPPTFLIAVAILLTFTMATFSYRFIEKPFRSTNNISSKSILYISTISCLFFVVIGGVGHFTGGFKTKRFEQNSYVQTLERSPKNKQCHTSGKNYLKPIESCVYFEGQANWASFGDSHVVV